MPYPHAIRLRGPWQLEPLCRYLAAADGTVVESRENLPPPGRTTVPSDWGDVLGEFRGRVRYRRSFQSPPALDPHERVWLVVDGIDARGAVTLNGQPLGEIAGYALGSSFEVTRFLSTRNEVVIDIEMPLNTAAEISRPGRELLSGGLIREVRLEIRSPWSIDDLAVWSTAAGSELVAAGQVAGEVSGSGFAVIFSGCQRELAYLELRRRERFEVCFEADEFPTWTPGRPALATIEVKLLVGSSSVWRTELETGLRGGAVIESSQILDAILDAAAYCEFDRKGIPVIQRVPFAWADKVCHGLAYHPSIIAWTAAPGETSPAAPLYGRPWLEQKVILPPCPPGDARG